MKFSKALLYSRLGYAIEIFVVAAFIFALYWSLHTLAELNQLRQKCKTLENTVTALDRLEKKIEGFSKLKSSLFPASANQKIDYHWEEVSLQFEPIEFENLLRRLAMLNTEIQKKYHKRGIFVLTDFETFTPKHSQGNDNNQQPNTVKKSQKPGFKIEGKLLCLRQ